MDICFCPYSVLIKDTAIFFKKSSEKHWDYILALYNKVQSFYSAWINNSTISATVVSVTCLLSPKSSHLAEISITLCPY